MFFLFILVVVTATGLLNRSTMIIQQMWRTTFWN